MAQKSSGARPIWQKKCTRCGEWKNRNRDFYTAGYEKVASRCKECLKELSRQKYHSDPKERARRSGEYKKAYVRARSKTLTRVKNIVPELFEVIMEEEMHKQGYTDYKANISKADRASVVRKIREEK